LKNRSQFESRLYVSQLAVAVAAKWLRLQPGIVKVTVPMLQMKQRDNGDMVMDRGRGPERVEVVWRDFSFSCRDDFPYPNIVVGQAFKWEREGNRPSLVLVFNSELDAVAVISVESSMRWVKQKFNNLSGPKQLVYTAHLDDVEFHSFPREWRHTVPHQRDGPI
jgi:hypothetical protein